MNFLDRFPPATSIPEVYLKIYEVVSLDASVI